MRTQRLRHRACARYGRDQAAAFRRAGRERAGVCHRRTGSGHPDRRSGEARAIVGQLPTGSRNTHFFALSQDEQRIFTSNVGDRTLSVIDVPGRKLACHGRCGRFEPAHDVSPDGRWFVTSLWQSRKVAFYPHGGSISWISPWTSTARHSSGASARMAATSTTWAWSPMCSRPASACGRSTLRTRAGGGAAAARPLGVGTGGIQVNPAERPAVPHCLQWAGLGAGSGLAATCCGSSPRPIHPMAYSSAAGR